MNQASGNLLELIQKFILAFLLEFLLFIYCSRLTSEIISKISSVLPPDDSSETPLEDQSGPFPGLSASKHSAVPSVIFPEISFEIPKDVPFPFFF